jgi:hypothetical protein
MAPTVVVVVGVGVVVGVVVVEVEVGRVGGIPHPVNRIAATDSNPSVPALARERRIWERRTKGDSIAARS